MAFSVNGDPDEPMADINVTPLVDVMLVLLIIFMIAAPMLHQGIEVALPRAEARNLPLRVEDPLVVSIDRDGLVYLRETPVHPTQLVERLLPMLKARGDDSVFVKGDRDVPYGVVAQVLGMMKKLDVAEVGLVAVEPENALTEILVSLEQREGLVAEHFLARTQLGEPNDAVRTEHGEAREDEDDARKSGDERDASVARHTVLQSWIRRRLVAPSRRSAVVCAITKSPGEGQRELA